MKGYGTKAEKIIEQFTARCITEQECLAALDSAVAAALRTVSPGDLTLLRKHAVRDYLTVKAEVARRRRSDRTLLG